VQGRELSLETFLQLKAAFSVFITNISQVVSVPLSQDFGIHSCTTQLKGKDHSWVTPDSFNLWFSYPHKNTINISLLAAPSPDNEIFLKCGFHFHSSPSLSFYHVHIYHFPRFTSIYNTPLQVLWQWVIVLS